jgi:hypothetical protein
MSLSVYLENSPFQQSCTAQVLKTYRRVVIAAVWRPWQRCLLRCLFMKMVINIDSRRMMHKQLPPFSRWIVSFFFYVAMRYIDRGVLCQIKHPAIIVSPFRTATLVDG